MGKTIVEEFVAVLGWEVDEKAIESFQSSIDKTISSVKTVTKVVTGTTVAILGSTGAMNVHTSRINNMSKAIGINAETLEALGGVAKNIGFDYENVADLVEEMNNKIGESAGVEAMSSVRDATKMLNIDLKELQKLAPEEQFLMLLDTAKEMEDQQQAVSAVDMLFGGEANKFLGLLRSYDMSLGEIIERQKELSMLTDEGRDGATNFGFAFNELQTIAVSLFAEFSGLMGQALIPLIKGFSDWFLENKKIIKLNMVKFIKAFVRFLKILFDILKKVFSATMAVVDAFGGLGNLIKVITVALTSFFAVMAVSKILMFAGAIKKAGGALVFFNKILNSTVLKASGIALFAVAMFLLIEDIKTFLEGGDSLVGRLNEKIQPAINDAIDSVMRFGAELIGVDFDTFRLAFVETIESMPENFLNVFSNIRLIAVWVTEDIKSFFRKMWNNITGGIMGAIGYFKKGLTAIKNSFFRVGASIYSYFSGVFNNLVGKFKWLVGTVKSSVNSVKGYLPDFITGDDSPASGSPSTAGSGNNDNSSKVNNVVINNNNTVNANGGSASDGATIAVENMAKTSAEVSRNLKTQMVY